jgi:hypothetical protein
MRHPLKAACSDQDGAVVRKTGEQGSPRKDGHADLKDDAAAIDIAKAPAKKEQAAKRQNVSIDHPGQIGGADAQFIVGSAMLASNHQARHQLRCRDDKQREECTCRFFHRNGRA